MFKTIIENSTYEITEKKSKFIANLICIENKEDAENKIKEYKKLYHDARHNCSAYRVIDNGIIYEKSSDDGEPSGTAGAPMLNILQKNDLCNVLIIVTRYFGGILLGTGGLVRCYSEVTLGAVNSVPKFNIEEGIQFELEVDYDELEQIRYFCKKNNFNIVNINYSEKVICKIEVKNKSVKLFLEEIKNKKEDKIKVIKWYKKYIREN